MKRAEPNIIELFDNLLGAQEALAESISLLDRIRITPDCCVACQVVSSLPRSTMVNVVLPLSIVIDQTVKKHDCPLIGIVGGPGAGKTTLSFAVEWVLSHVFSQSRNVLRISLEDFYYSAQERLRRGLAWRALPGTHDLRALLELLSRAKSGESELIVPDFDMRSGDHRQPKVVRGPVDICILEGWLIGYDVEEYSGIATSLDFLIYLDAALHDLESWRIGREVTIHNSTQGREGLDEPTVKRFWDEVLGPGTLKWVRPIINVSDLVLTLDSDHQVVSARRRTDCGNRD